MNIQEQLANSVQAPASALTFLTLYNPLDVGVLGNVSVQTASKTVGAWQFSRLVGAPAVIVVPPVNSPESAEMAWLVRNAQQLGRYKGEWLLIQAAQLVAHNRDFAAVLATIRQRQIDSPFVYYVPTDDESNSITI